MVIGNLQLSNNIFLAPLAGYTDRPFRVLAKRHGAGMVFSEMVSAKGLIYENRVTKHYIKTCSEEYPLAVQLFGGEPEPVAEAARIVAEEGAAVVDINMGCPVRKVLKGGAGAALLRDLPRAEKILTAVRKAVSLPVTIKVRSGWDNSSINCIDMARMAEDCGANALTLHPRTARQLFTGAADWSKIRDVAAAVSIPVIGSGDVKSYLDVFRMEKETGCDGVMIGRAALGNPWIFEDVLAFRSGGTPQRHAPRAKLATILDHIEMAKELYGEAAALNQLKGHILHYLKGFHGVKEVRRQVCAQVHDVDELREGIKEFFENIAADHTRDTSIKEQTTVSEGRTG